MFTGHWVNHFFINLLTNKRIIIVQIQSFQHFRMIDFFQIFIPSRTVHCRPGRSYYLNSNSTDYRKVLCNNGIPAGTTLVRYR